MKKRSRNMHGLARTNDIHCLNCKCVNPMVDAFHTDLQARTWHSTYPLVVIDSSESIFP